MGYVADIYWLSIGWLWANHRLAISYLWAGHGMGYGLAIGYQSTGHGLAMGWLWTGYGLAMDWLRAGYRLVIVIYYVQKLDMAASNTLDCSVFTRFLAICWLLAGYGPK